MFGYFRSLSLAGMGEVLQELAKTKRLKEGLNEHPPLLIVDARIVKNVGKGEQIGIDGGKEIKAQKHQITVDIEGSLH